MEVVMAGTIVVVKAAWTILLVYVGVRLALRHERQPNVGR